MPIARLAWSTGSFVSVQLRLGTGIPVEEPKSTAHCTRPPASMGHPCRGLTAPRLQEKQGLLPATLRNPQTQPLTFLGETSSPASGSDPSSTSPGPSSNPKKFSLSLLRPQTQKRFTSHLSILSPCHGEKDAIRNSFENSIRRLPPTLTGEAPENDAGREQLVTPDSEEAIKDS